MQSATVQAPVPLVEKYLPTGGDPQLVLTQRADSATALVQEGQDVALYFSSALALLHFFVAQPFEFVPPLLEK